LLQGKLVYNTYEDKNGQKRTSAEIWANDFQIINGNKSK
jgi:single-stranded DNA-binding protein